MPAITHRFVDADADADADVDGLKVFVREAGDPAAPTLVLLPGFPSSGRAYVRLIDRVATKWHTVAIDYPGFGNSDSLTGPPTFDRLAEVTADAIDALDVTEYAIYMFDIGAPVGCRIALRHDQRVRGIVTQNGNAYTDGVGPLLQGSPSGGTTAPPDSHCRYAPPAGARRRRPGRHTPAPRRRPQPLDTTTSSTTLSMAHLPGWRVNASLTRTATDSDHLRECALSRHLAGSHPQVPIIALRSEELARRPVRRFGGSLPVPGPIG
jgi:pimeloyl-ACP methyl ester carboxylesterase